MEIMHLPAHLISAWLATIIAGYNTNATEFYPYFNWKENILEAKVRI